LHASRDLLATKAPLLSCAGYTSNNGKHPRFAVSQASYLAASNTADENAAGQRSGIGICHFPSAEPYICERGKNQTTIRGLTCQKDGGRPNRRTSSTSFAQSSMTCCGGSCVRVRMFSQGMLQYRGILPRHRPWLSSWRPSYL
jgi:hypothetical protein